MNKKMQTISNYKAKNLLFLSYYFPPVQVSSSIRIMHFFEGFIANGFTISVLTGKFPKKMAGEQTINLSISNIYHIPLIGLRRLMSNFILTHNTLPLMWKKKVFISSLLSFRNRIPLNIIIGDGGLIYLWIAYFNAAKWIKDHKITHIFTSYSPMVDHFIAFLLKCTFPHLHWVADFRDLPVDVKYPHYLNHTICKHFLKYLLKKADAVITVSKGIANELEKFRTNINIYSGCISPEEVQHPTIISPNFNINYTGSIYPDYQDLYPLVKVILSLIEEGIMNKKDIFWTYCGLHPYQYAQWLMPHFPKEQIDIKAYLPLSEAQKRQREATINLVLTWSTSVQKGILTTKLFEYLATGKPILVLANGVLETEMKRILSCYQTEGYFQNSENKRLKDWITTMYKGWKNNQIYHCDRKKIAQKFSENERNALIKKVSDRTPTRKNT
jgi:glycosyltransferase involved in cell wall biosynthesis